MLTLGRLGRFWQATLDYVQQPPPEGYASWAEYDAAHGGQQGDEDGYMIVDPEGSGPPIFFQPVPSRRW